MAEYHGGGTSGNSWAASSVTDMWAMLESHDSGPHRQMSAAWKKSYELVLTHLSQVKQYRDNLATAWPPEKNKAAAAYVDELNGLIANLEETYAAAISNHRALSTATDAIEEAKGKLSTIQQEYAANQGLLDKYQEQLRNRPVVPKGVAPVPQSPVADGRQVQLEQDARVVMASLSAELATAQTSFIAPKPYTPPLGRTGTDEAFDPGGTGINVPAMAPSFSPRSIDSVKTSKPASTSPRTSTKPIDTVRARIEQPTTYRPSPSEGPVLGATKPSVNPPTTSIPPTSNNLPSSLTVPDSYSSFSPTNNSSSPNTAPRLPATSTSPFGTHPPTTGHLSPTTGVRGGGLPHGGVIGGSPHIGSPPIGSAPSGRASQAGPSGRSGPKINPVGGLIGQDGFGRPGSRQPSRKDEDPLARRWDPDNPWETDCGMDPILLPAPEQRIDPGPTIGGR